MNIVFDKMGGLVPAIVQDSRTLKVWMLGFMNEEAYKNTLARARSRFTAAAENAFGQRAKHLAIALTW